MQELEDILARSEAVREYLAAREGTNAVCKKLGLTAEELQKWNTEEGGQAVLETLKERFGLVPLSGEFDYEVTIDLICRGAGLTREEETLFRGWDAKSVPA